MSPRTTLKLLVVVVSLTCANAQAKYVKIAGAPGFGPAKYANLHIDKMGSPKARRVLVLIPGTFAGSADFAGVGDYLSTHVPNLQVWAIDRRPNQLEDTSYMLKALKGQITGQQLFDYYLGWIEHSDVQPHYQPLKDADFPFAKKWGLKLAMEDTRRVVTLARKGGRKVILGGHSPGPLSGFGLGNWGLKGPPGFKGLNRYVRLRGGGMGDS